MNTKKNIAGFHLLSYFQEMELIEFYDLKDTDDSNEASGSLLKDLFGIPAGSYVFISILDGKTINIYYVLEKDWIEFNDNDIACNESMINRDWKKEPFSKKITKEIHFLFI